MTWFLERRGVIIGGNDLWIAATTLAHGATLVTNNTSEFDRIPGILIEDWAQP
jgi:tRNA(fMet)-specific endonuclease VapC